MMAAPSSLRATALVCGVVLAVLGHALWSFTGGLEHWTFESLRRARAAGASVQAAAVALRDSHNTALVPWAPSAGTARPPVLIVDFIYTRCPSVCQALGSTYQKMQARLKSERIEDVKLLSVSFDIAHDDAAALSHYGRLHRAQPQHWRLATPTGAADAANLLQSLGVVVIADGAGGYVHNAALHLIDSRGRLLAIHDHDDWPAAIAQAQRWARPGPPP